jgi:hypothetical protein
MPRKRKEARAQEPPGHDDGGAYPDPFREDQRHPLRDLAERRGLERDGGATLLRAEEKDEAEERRDHERGGERADREPAPRHPRDDDRRGAQVGERPEEDAPARLGGDGDLEPRGDDVEKGTTERRHYCSARRSGRAPDTRRALTPERERLRRREVGE